MLLLLSISMVTHRVLVARAITQWSISTSQYLTRVLSAVITSQQRTLSTCDSFDVYMRYITFANGDDYKI